MKKFLRDYWLLPVSVIVALIFVAISYPVCGCASRMLKRQFVSRSSLRQLDLALTQYARDNEGSLPPMADANALHANLQAYVQNDTIFISSLTQTPFLANPAASGREIASLPDPAEFVLLYEDKPIRYGRFKSKSGRCVLFANGRATWATAQQWPRLKRVSGLP